MRTKRCSTCGAEKLREEFYNSKKSADGLRYQCIDCAKAAKAEWRGKNPEKVADQKLRYKKKNPDKVRAQKARTQSRRVAKTGGRIDADIRTAMNINIRCILRYGSDVYGLLGYDAKKLMDKIEAGFKPGMTWENYGLSGWHIDHEFPLSAAEYATPHDSEFKMVWSLSNLQPLWAEENIAKGATVPAKNG